MKINLDVEFKFTKDVEEFIEGTIFPALKIDELNEDNIDDVTEYAASIEIFYLGSKNLPKDKKELFRMAVKAGDQLCLCINELNKKEENI